MLPVCVDTVFDTACVSDGMVVVVEGIVWPTRDNVHNQKVLVLDHYVVVALLVYCFICLTKPIFVTTDSGANIIAAFKSLKLLRISCFGHNLDLAIKESPSSSHKVIVMRAHAQSRLCTPTPTHTAKCVVAVFVSTSLPKAIQPSNSRDNYALTTLILILILRIRIRILRTHV